MTTGKYYVTLVEGGHDLPTPPPDISSTTGSTPDILSIGPQTFINPLRKNYRIPYDHFIYADRYGQHKLQNVTA